VILEFYADDIVIYSVSRKLNAIRASVQVSIDRIAAYLRNRV